MTKKIKAPDGAFSFTQLITRDLILFQVFVLNLL